MPCAVCGWSGDERYCPGCGATLRAERDANECAVVISFDVDGASGMINRDPGIEHRPSAVRSATMARPSPCRTCWRCSRARRPRLRSTSPDGSPSAIRPSLSGSPRTVTKSGITVICTNRPRRSPRRREAAVLDRGSEILSGITGEAPAGYRSPSWELSDHSLDLLRERGFTYDSSLMGGDAPVLGRTRARRVADPLGAGTTTPTSSSRRTMGGG